MTRSIVSSRAVTARPRRHRLLAVLAAITLGVGFTTASTPAHAADAGFCPDGSQPYVPVSEVEAFSPGTGVTGLSVTSGTTPDGFTGSYIGHVANWFGKGKDLPLFRLSSPVIDGTSGTKAAGIWAGMSGSPVYAQDGRLIGAVSYALNADNLPIAGVTPAEYMKSIGTTALGAARTGRLTGSAVRVSSAGTKVAGTNLVGSSISQIRTVDVAGSAGPGQNAFVNRTLARTPRTAKAASFVRSNSFLPAAAQSAQVTAPLVAGGSVAALYGSDDLVTGAIGTVTAVCGDTVWAFGHPMAYAGSTTLLLANASTAMIVPDSTGVVGSYKQVSAFGAPVGMVTQDRAVGIRGTIGAVHAFPVDVAVQNASGTEVAAYHGELANQELTGSAVAYLIGEAAIEQLDQVGSGTAEVTWTIDYRRADGTEESLTNSQVVSDRLYFPDAIGTDAGNDAWAITDNEFEDVAITGVSATLTLVSADAISYKAAKVQLRGKTGQWKALSGNTLKAGKTYALRPQYTVKKNGKASGSAYGDPISVKLSTKARKSGAFTFGSASGSLDEVCDIASGSTVNCADWDEDEPQYSDFDELIADLDSLQPASLVSGELRYRLKKGSTSKGFEWTGPGVVIGSASGSFSIRA
nr:SpoIVB peptidase S55 domain-containing protein [Propionicimonas sp.]